MDTIKLRFDHTQLTLGAIFFEDCYGTLCRFEVTEEPVVKEHVGGKTLEWKGKHLDDPECPIVNFMVSEALEHYGPKIYLTNEIVEYNGLKFKTR